MRCIVKTFRRPPTGRIRDRNGGLPRLSDGVAHASRCPASPQRTLRAENLGKPARRVMISDPWYKPWRRRARSCVREAGASPCGPKPFHLREARFGGRREVGRRVVRRREVGGRTPWY
ncbi:MAG: hypothetical protein IID50_08300 [Proteobacteria bacterium]|nr:hypothetical protein [Pseudomonadota bacterium]